MVVSMDYLTGLTKLKIGDTQSGEGKLSTLQNVVVFEDEITAENRLLCEEAGLNVYSLNDVYKKGQEAEKKNFREPTPDTCSAFSYTSGTTGDPKGVKLTHSMLL